jgi:hypothetical protein
MTLLKTPADAGKSSSGDARGWRERAGIGYWGAMEQKTGIRNPVQTEE